VGQKTRPLVADSYSTDRIVYTVNLPYTVTLGGAHDRGRTNSLVYRSRDLLQWAIGLQWRRRLFALKALVAECPYAVS